MAVTRLSLRQMNKPCATYFMNIYSNIVFFPSIFVAIT